MPKLKVLFPIRDEHRRDTHGCDDHPLAKTPNLDKLGSGVSAAREYYRNTIGIAQSQVV